MNPKGLQYYNNLINELISHGSYETRFLSSSLIKQLRGILPGCLMNIYFFPFLISHNVGIEAHVTLNHWDLPQTLEDEYGGWVSRRVVYGSQTPSL